MDINTECLPSSISRNVKRQPRPSWKKASTIKQKAFTDLISKNLNKITVPQECNCNNVHCRDIDHIEYIDEYVLNILDTVEMSSKEYLVKKDNGKKGHKKTIPGWNEYIAQALDKAKFWFAVWESSGRPMNTALHNIMKRTCNWYHYQIRKIKHAEKDIILSNKLLLSAAEDRIDFFQQVRNMRKSNEESAGEIDGMIDNIPDHFTAIYRELFSSVSADNEIKIIKKDIEDPLSTCNIQDLEKIISSCVKRAVKKLKPSKNDSVYTISSDCLIKTYLFI